MSDFLYPFLDDRPPDFDALLVDLISSAEAKIALSEAVRTRTVEHETARIESAASAMAERFRAGGRLFTFGNGGSSTDAAAVAALYASSLSGAPLPARCLAEDGAVLTALGNDVGFDLVFSRQMIAHAVEGDIALGMSTSGGSRNVLAAFREARGRGLLTVGFAGGDGGEMSRSADVDFCFVVRSDSIHRIQEAHGALSFALWTAVRARLATAASRADHV